MIDNYTSVLEAAAETADAEVVDGTITKLIMHLKSAGRIKMLPQIASELRRIAARRRALRPYVEVAHHEEAEVALKEAAQDGIIATRAHVNHSLISGWRARQAGKLVDKTAKRALLQIYQKVTN